MKEKTNTPPSGLEAMLGVVEGLEGKIGAACAHEQVSWGRYDGVLARLRARCEGLDQQARTQKTLPVGTC